MLTPEFHELFRELASTFIRYHEAPRDPESVCELARRRFELESIRAAIARERMVMAALAMTPSDGHWLEEIGVRGQ